MSLVGPRPGCGLRRLCENLENGRSTFLGRRTEELAGFVAFLPCNPLLVNILPATLVASIFCRDFRLSPPIISIFYRGRGGEGYPRPTVKRSTPRRYFTSSTSLPFSP